MGLRLSDVGDIQHNYQLSVLYYDRHPVLVSRANVAMDLGRREYSSQLGYTPLPFINRPNDEPKHWAFWDDPKWSEGPFRLGYVNGLTSLDLTTVAFMASRIPLRRWKQGLSDENLFLANGDGFWSILQHKEFTNMLTGSYPSMQTAQERLGDKVRRVAFSRHWAVGLEDDKAKSLWFRGNKIGEAASFEKLQPSKKYEWLREPYSELQHG